MRLKSKVSVARRLGEREPNISPEYVQKYASKDTSEDSEKDNDDDDEMSSVGSYESGDEDEAAGNMEDI